MARASSSWLVGLGLVGLGSVAGIASCVADTTSNGAGPGTLGGPCLQNGTCNAGLTCAIVGSSALCEQPDASTDGSATDAGADQSAADGGDAAPGVDASDAAPPCEAGITTPAFTCNATWNDCYDIMSSAHTCQASSSGCMGTYSMFFMAYCFADTCPGTQACCVSNATVTAGCPGTIQLNPGQDSVCSSSSACTSSTDTALCSPTHPCSSGTCIPARVTGVPGLMGQVFGYCQ